MIKSIDSQLMGNDDSTTLREQHVSLLKDITHVELAQKAKIQWYIEGDENSGIFMGSLIARDAKL